jgi:hypothetical protein
MILYYSKNYLDYSTQFSVKYSLHFICSDVVVLELLKLFGRYIKNYSVIAGDHFQTSSIWMFI